MPKILVADDNANIQKMVSLALEERGISVVAVGNGEAAVRRIPDLDPDLVLADIFMPVRNGYEVCEFVKKDERFAHVPVILLVGAFDPLDEKEARRVGADGVLKKPFVPPDPLIAMVTSALEKNPRVAAELAKAKEAKMAPPEPEPLPSVDLSMRPEPKPLPEFPEPTAEEAALIYGMGKGHRALKDDEGDADDEPPAPKLDVTSHVADEDEEDQASTAADWRRSAMDIEIPEDLANKPAIPSRDDLEPISFPSEKDFPPRRVQRPEPVEAAQPPLSSDFPMNSNGFSLRRIEEPGAKATAKTPPPAIEPESLKLQAEPEPQPPIGLHVVAPSSPPSSSLPEPNSTAAGGHWLDAVAASHAGKTAGNWMDSLIEAPAPEPEMVSQSDAAVEEPPVAIPEAQASSAPEIAEEESPAELQTAASYVEPAQLQEAQHHVPDQDDSFFADESSADEAAVTESVSEAHAEVFAKASADVDHDIEVDADDSEASPVMKDPALVEPPAVHVTPEPLLVDEEPDEPSRYGTPVEETSPLHSFLAPAAEAPAAALSAAPLPNPTEFSIQPESDSSAEASGEEVTERIPTMPPPNLEALSHIPFLTPPPSFLAEISNGNLRAANAADPATIDAVVQKVLEKLQPQIQELLSQSLLKPLVENLLQNQPDKKR